MPPQADLLPGTLDVLILKAVSLGGQHGYGVLLRIEQITGGAMAIGSASNYSPIVHMTTRTTLRERPSAGEAIADLTALDLHRPPIPGLGSRMDAMRRYQRVRRRARSGNVHAAHRA